MDTNPHEQILFKEESYQIIGRALDVLKEVGHGYHEKPYENALTIAFRHNNIPYEQQREFPILYRQEKIGTFIPDLIAFDKIVIDTKVIDKITDHERGQMLNYLRIIGLRLGIIINFKHAKLEYERIVL
ncbi:MAG: GxxExxY protein [Kiritimatiellales bacterium]|nr:GxxExxY protein [Kiritimatiellota bacterium]MBL7012571.1 GxxExxY protein [Kiritimatiellales bacterium]